MSVTQLGYLGLAVQDQQAWETLLTDALGCALASSATAGESRFRIDDRMHRISLKPAQADGLDHLGFEVDTQSELAELADLLRERGFAVTLATAEELDARQVREMVHTIDPAGNRVEFYHGPTLDDQPFVSSLGLSGFVGGTLGLGHAALSTTRYQETQNFYRMVGFKVSDYITTDDLEAVFLHCNGRHHTLAIIRLPGDEPMTEFQHFMLETPDLDAVGRALDRCVESGASIPFSLGKHTNDRMVSFYVTTPSGFEIEYGTGGRLIAPDWDVDQYRSASVWGHRHPTN